MSGVRKWGFWTEQKLDILAGYLSGFLSATKHAGRPPYRLYVDTHAGQGEAVSKHESRPIKTSAQIARDAKDNEGASGFQRIVLIELAHAEQLRRNIQADDDPRVSVHEGSCEEILPSVLDALKPANGAHIFWPTIVFVDPDGFKDMKWNTLAAAASFKAGERADGKPVRKAELYFLFSDSGIVRNIGREAAAPTLDAITESIGSEDWLPLRERFLAGQTDFDTTCNELVNLMRWRLEHVLGYGYTHTLPFVNTRNRPHYQMIFATDSEAGSTIIGHLYRQHAAKMPDLRRGAIDRASGQQTLDFGDLVVNDRNHINYRHSPPVDPDPEQR